MADAIHPASRQRSALWRAACAKRITTEELYRRLADLRSKYSDEAIYDNEARARKRRMAA